MGKLFEDGIAAEDEIYVALRDYPHHSDAKDFIETMWRVYEPYADSLFRSEITKAFYQRYWEMYLTWGLLENGYLVSSADEGPDVGVELDSGLVWLEAITPLPGQGKDEVKYLESEDGQVAVGAYPEEKILLRIRGAIEEKHKKYLRYVQRGTIASDAPYVVAINGRQIPYAFLRDEFPIAVRAVYPFGNPRVVVDRGSFEVLRSDHEYRPEVMKANGAPVGTETFGDEKYSGVSALLFSCACPVNRRGDYGDDFVLVHNFKAANPLPKGSFRFGREFWPEDKDDEMSLESRSWISSEL